MSSRRSEWPYTKMKNNLIPGKACEFVIEVPKGRHTYDVIPMDKDKSNVLGSCLFPKKDVRY